MQASISNLSEDPAMVEGADKLYLAVTTEDVQATKRLLEEANASGGGCKVTELAEAAKAMRERGGSYHSVKYSSEVDGDREKITLSNWTNSYAGSDHVVASIWTKKCEK
jgi:hypothetical protein